jgi:hypothetical protein
MERLVSKVVSMRCASTSRVTASLERAVAAYSGDSTPVDDITLLVIKRL